MPSLIKCKSGIFYLVSSTKGKRKWVSLRTRNREEAYRSFIELTSREGKGNDGQNLSHSIEEYLGFVACNFAAKTLQVYRAALRQLLTFLGDIPLSDISSKHLDLYKIERTREVRAATVNIEIRAFRAFFNCLRRWEIIVKNPCDGIREIRTAEGVPAYLRQDELRLLLASVKDHWLKDIITFAAMTGVRLGELLNITRDDVNLNACQICIRSSKSYRVKGGKMRVIPLNQDAVDVLRGRRGKEGVIFQGIKGGRASANFVSRKFREAARRAGVEPRIHFHSLRHTFASLLVERGVSLYQVQHLLGHSSARVTEIYAHLQASDMHTLVDRISLVGRELAPPSEDLVKPPSVLMQEGHRANSVYA